MAEILGPCSQDLLGNESDAVEGRFLVYGYLLSQFPLPLRVCEGQGWEIVHLQTFLTQLCRFQLQQFMEALANRAYRQIGLHDNSKWEIELVMHVM